MIDNYTNTLLQINLTSSQIEDQIRNYPMEFSQIRNMRIEGHTNAPLFLYSFYSFVLNESIIPTQTQYWEHYINRAKEWLDQNGCPNSSLRLSALQARAYRAYPSFVRDIHFSKLLVESKKFQEVFYNETLDAIEGIDIIVVKNNKQYCIRLHVKTSRSAEWKKKKDNRHDYGDLNEIIVSMDFDKAKKCGEFFLYSTDDIVKIESYITKKERAI